jgi:hypothetical protein
MKLFGTSLSEILVEFKANSHGFPRWNAATRTATFVQVPDEDGKFVDQTIGDVSLSAAGMVKCDVYMGRKIEYKSVLCNTDGGCTTYCKGREVRHRTRNMNMRIHLIIPIKHYSKPANSVWIVQVRPRVVRPPLIANHRFPTVNLRYDGKIVPFDERCLVEASPYFASKLSEPWESKEKIVEIEQSAEVVDAMLSFLRGETIETLPDEVLVGLAMLADKFDMTSLMELCESLVVQQMKKSRILPFLPLFECESFKELPAFLSAELINKKDSFSKWMANTHPDKAVAFLNPVPVQNKKRGFSDISL